MLMPYFLREPTIIKRVYDYNLKEADRVRELTDDILHEIDDKGTVSGTEAYDSIKSTFAFIEDLLR